MTPEQELCPKCGLKKAVWSHIECCTEGFTEPPCPSCVALRARCEDVEGMGRIMHELWTRTKRAKVALSKFRK
jgi:hypothetical protein